MTPTKISSGASHDRSNDRTTVTSAVPTSAPSITASAGAVPIKPWPANAATISAVAVLLWMSAVTPRPATNAEPRWRYAAPQDAAQVAAVEAQDAGAHDVRAPHQQRDARQQVEQELHQMAGQK